MNVEAKVALAQDVARQFIDVDPSEAIEIMVNMLGTYIVAAALVEQAAWELLGISEQELRNVFAASLVEKFK